MSTTKLTRRKRLEIFRDLTGQNNGGWREKLSEREIESILNEYTPNRPKEKPSAIKIGIVGDNWYCENGCGRICYTKTPGKIFRRPMGKKIWCSTCYDRAELLQYKRTGEPIAPYIAETTEDIYPINNRLSPTDSPEGDSTNERNNNSMHLRNGRPAIVGLVVIGVISGIPTAGTIIATTESDTCNILIETSEVVQLADAYGAVNVSPNGSGKTLTHPARNWGRAKDFLHIKDAQSLIQEVEKVAAETAEPPAAIPVPEAPPENVKAPEPTPEPVPAPSAPTETESTPPPAQETVAEPTQAAS